MTKSQHKALRDFQRGLRIAERARVELPPELAEVPQVRSLLDLLAQYGKIQSRRSHLSEQIRKAFIDLDIDPGDWPVAVGAKVRRMCGL